MENRIKKNEKLKKKIKNGETLCLSCSVIIPKGGLKEHSKSATHKYNVKKITVQKMKRISAEKFSDDILLAYQKLVPKPFKGMSVFKMSTIQAMDMRNEISLDVEGIDDKTKSIAKDYCKSINRQLTNSSKKKKINGKQKSGKPIKSTKVLVKRKPKKAINNKVRKGKKNPVGQKNSKK